MIIQADTRQKRGHHTNKEKWFENHGIKVIHSKCIVGDYIIPSDGSISVDTKKDVSELYQNLVQSHNRFVAECNLADELGIKLYILVENDDGIRTLDDLINWKNPQYIQWLRKQRQGVNCKPPVQNISLIKMAKTIEKKYGCTFLFCHPYESAEIIVKLLTDGKENEND